MHSDLHLHLAAADPGPRFAPAPARVPGPPAPGPRPEPDLVLRRGTPADASALRRLAQLDSVAPLGEDVLLAFLDGVLVAALALTGDRVAADPFAPTGDAVALLRLRARQIALTAGPRRARRRRRFLLPRWG